MFRKHNGQLVTTPPATIVVDGFVHNFFDLGRTQDGTIDDHLRRQIWNDAGYNEAVQVKREPFTTYETMWAVGDDLIAREEIVSAVVDEMAKAEHEAREARSKRDRLLAESDWTQLQDAVLNADETALWQAYRQALRDVPGQAEFPASVVWPDKPSTLE